MANGNGKQAEQLRMRFMRFLGLVMAMAFIEFWNSPFDEVFYPGGRRIRVKIEKMASPDDTKPIPDERLQFGKSE